MAYTKGVTLSDALAAAAAIAPLGRAIIYCYELYHPSLDEPVRFADNKEDFFATLETGAPFNSSQSVEFIAMPVTAQRPEESDSAGTPEISLSASNVSSILGKAFRNARGSMVPWTVIERIYASDLPTFPLKLPVLTYELSAADISALQAQVKASYGDPVNFSIPRLTFKREEYPGLEI